MKLCTHIARITLITLLAVLPLAAGRSCGTGQVMQPEPKIIIMDKQTFIKTYGPAVQSGVKGTGIFASVKLAQMALETGWGDSIRHAGNNCFGIKASAKWPGKVVSNTTRETLAGVSKVFKGTGQTYDTYAAAADDVKQRGLSYFTLFKAYDSIEESINDHTNLLLSAGRYAAARKATSPEQQAELIHQAGYATAENYSKLLKSIIKTNNLKQFDK